MYAYSNVCRTKVRRYELTKCTPHANHTLTRTNHGCRGSVRRMAQRAWIRRRAAGVKPWIRQTEENCWRLLVASQNSKANFSMDQHFSDRPHGHSKTECRMELSQRDLQLSRSSGNDELCSEPFRDIGHCMLHNTTLLTAPCRQLTVHEPNVLPVDQKT